MVEAQPERRRRRKLGVSAADPAAGEECKGDGEHRQCGADVGQHVGRLIPVASARAKKPATRISETRFEMVIVNRSLEAANAIRAGNSRSWTVWKHGRISRGTMLRAGRLRFRYRRRENEKAPDFTGAFRR
jgi:hypothetical protein